MELIGFSLVALAAIGFVCRLSEPEPLEEQAARLEREEKRRNRE